MCKELFSRSFITVRAKLASPLSIGTGENNTEIVCDDNMVPYVPASSMAGVLRHAMPNGTAKRLFGYVSRTRGTQEECVDSRIIISDGSFLPGWKYIIREGTRINDDQVAADGTKFSVGAIDAGAEFIITFEVDLYDESEITLIDAFLSSLSALGQGSITMGHKSNRGFGKIAIVSCRLKTYSRNELLKSLDHTPEQETEVILPETAMGWDLLDFPIKFISPVCVRVYTPLHDVNIPNLPDCVPLMSGGVPVIPGTSWAGVFRHGAKKILCRFGLSPERSEELCAQLFGMVNEQHALASSVRFDDTCIMGGAIRSTTRTAIDRFAGGAANQSLYTEALLYPDVESTSRLRIHVQPDKEWSQWGKELLLLLIGQLNEGLLCVGGGSSVGRGLVKVDQVVQNEYPTLHQMLIQELKHKE